MSAPAAMFNATQVCENCAGDGYILESRRIAGEGMDADWCEVPCHVCDGSGKGDWVPTRAPVKSSAETRAAYLDACRRIDAVFGRQGLPEVDHMGRKGVGL